MEYAELLHYLAEGLILILAFNVRVLFLRIDKNEDKHVELTKDMIRAHKGFEAQLAKLREDMHRELKAVYSHSDGLVEKLRNEINDQGRAIRAEMRENSDKVQELIIKSVHPK